MKKRKGTFNMQYLDKCFPGVLENFFVFLNGIIIMITFL